MFNSPIVQTPGLRNVAIAGRFVRVLVVALSATVVLAGGPELPLPRGAKLSDVDDVPEAPAPGDDDVAPHQASDVIRFAWPVCSDIFQDFGYHLDPKSKRYRFHTGIDFDGAYGDSVRASASGVVIAAERRGPYGLMIEIDHGKGLRTRYSQLQATLVQSSERVERGLVIGRVGASGRAAGPHLHFEVWVHDVVRDALTTLCPRPECGSVAGRDHEAARRRYVQAQKSVPWWPLDLTCR